MNETNQPTGTKRLVLVLVIALAATAAIGALAPTATAATCSSTNAQGHAESSGKSCSSDCNWFGCNAQAHD